MRSRRLQYGLPVGVLLWCAGSVQASEEPPPLFEIKPLVCMVKTQGQTCQMTIRVNWHHSEPENLCLYQENKQLHCWQSSNQGTAKLAVKLAQNMEFSLRNSKQHTLARKTVKVNAVVSTKYRRKLKTDWSLF
ncbi:peptidoglycan-binding protein [Pseudoalteromonas rubra]|uniref:Peptidoglycan-binding protein n=1 Tax=Pseudoalteromonas rubra TaxID=43658 RepID=A0A5S3WJ91_9GAMM|nr:DUF3019 domain-containing protein [Pseudoalteromonas rubra]TMP26844.1 peptidoglycan-binding protein [Pseudoalteromonas rubra]TMP33771.1 peptidoglycan-binding protein [Pseudoalteromonas rubra]